MLRLNYVEYHFQLKVLRRISGASAVQSLRKLRTNTHFYIQGCVSAAIMIFALYAVQFIRLTTTRHLKYFLDTLAWELVQMSNGIVLIIFNKPFRNVFRPNLSLNRSRAVTPREMTFS
ncbi:unnamed protein product [Cylicostephanus goldi]|uniref:7TM GPCR serpentine receptor class x (Srx) domain-containing protein n=1 Tax=Cylicostephanus goldi TaxID=71465 RepID=A0A3P6R0I6_CYLGO|nr:unnamed protein product [Cylicostephanus goldi]